MNKQKRPAVLDAKLSKLTAVGPHIGIGSPMRLTRYTEIIDNAAHLAVVQCKYPKGFHMIVIPFALARDTATLDLPLTVLRDHLIALGWKPPKRKQVFVCEKETPTP